MGESGKLAKCKGSMQTAVPEKRQQNKVETCKAFFQEDRKEHMKCEEQTEERNSQTIFHKECHGNCVRFHTLKIRWEKFMETAVM